MATQIIGLPEYIAAGGHNLSLQVRRLSTSRRITLRLNPLKDEVTLTLPKRCHARTALSFLNEKKHWIEDHARKLPKRVPLTFGQTIPVFGEKRVITRANDVEEGDAEGVFAVLTIPSRCEATVKRMLKTQMLAYVTPRAESMARRIGHDITSIRLADPSGRWGSCGSDGRLMFSWRLIFAPKDVLDYVIAHEVAHLEEPNHSPDFWKIVGKLRPNYRAERSWLKHEGHLLMRYGKVSKEA